MRHAFGVDVTKDSRWEVPAAPLGWEGKIDKLPDRVQAFLALPDISAMQTGEK